MLHDLKETSSKIHSSMTRPALSAAAAWLAALIWLRPGPAALFGVDSACYARVARELAARPWREWTQLTLGGAPFYEHPPLALWIEAGFFRAAGASAETALLTARLYASITAGLVAATAGALAGSRAAVFAALALTLVPAFVWESQNAMLELPLMTCMALAIYGAARRRGALALFACGAAAAFWVKGPPALAVLPIPFWLAYRGRLPWRRAAGLAAAAVAVTIISTLTFDALRRGQGLPSFFGEYFRRQVLQSVVRGHTNGEPSPFYYVPFLLRWFLPALLALPVAVLAHRRRPELRLLLEIGWIFSASIVVGFSLPMQKYQWYIRPLVVGAAWFMGGALAWALKPAWDRAAAVIAGLAAAAWVVAVFASPAALRTPAQNEATAVARLPAPIFVAGEAAAIANCSTLADWRAEHLFQFYWGAAARPCASDAAWRFDGRGLAVARKI